MIKVVYFDDQSATDILNIENGGNLIETLVSEKGKDNTTSAEANVNIGAGIKKLIGFFKAEGEANLDINTIRNNSKFIESTISNTILTDFLNYIGDSESESIAKLEDYKIEVAYNSIAYFQRLTPYLSMMDGDFDIDENLKLNIEKIHRGLEFAKGYYELIAKKEENKSIFRFNNKSFKNNYYLTDLENMNLVLYGVEVGKMSLDNLDFTKLTEKWINNPDMSIEELERAVSSQYKNDDNKNLVNVYDIILAGVE